VIGAVTGRSPWEAALGHRMGGMHPKLRAYFSALPEGAVGRGLGVMDVVGSPRRCLWPVLAMLGAAHVIFPVWERDVRFTVVNRMVDGRLVAERTFRFARRTRVMRDEITARGAAVVDRVGPVAVELEPRIRDRGLQLHSTRVRLLGIPLPRAIAPRLALEERIVSGGQHVSLTLDLPVVGRVYEYRGRFIYRIEEP
jgi:hypothetical protein